jgi:hypothetical protein
MDADAKIELSNKWVLWAHLPHDTDWTIKSYKKILGFNALEDIIALNQTISDCVVKNCMLFLMLDNVTPLWEDKQNINGGCFSFKVNNKNVVTSWKRIVYCLIGNSITNDKTILKNITGITISPKKSFCIIKIWLSNCNHQNPRLLSKNIGLNFDGCLFKKHIN